MKKKDIHQVMAEIARLASEIEVVMTRALLHSGHLSRDRQELNIFCDAVIKAPFFIATSLPRPIYRNVIANAKKMIKEFGEDDESLRCKLSTVEGLLEYRERVMQHLIEHHRHTEKSTRRLDWDHLFDFYEEVDDAKIKIPSLLEEPESETCDACGQSFEYDDVAEFLPLDEKTHVEFWCGDCMKKRTSEVEA
jgi:hypothetical protein